MKVYDIDEAVLEQKPYIRLRGKLYPLRDMKVEERLRLMRSTFERQQELDQAGNDPNEAGKKLQDMLGEVLKQALEGVPDKVAESITELEFQAVQTAIAKARNIKLDIVAKNEQGVVTETEK